MPAALGGPGLASGFLLGLLSEDGGGARAARRVALPSSWVTCEGDPKPKAVKVPAPSCIDSGKDCSGKEDLVKLQKFAAAVDKSMKASLKRVKAARETFQRRACDFRYAEYENKGEVLENTYGPKGPLLPGGSYLFEMRRWADEAHTLYRACNRGFGGCQSLLQYLKEHPEDDVAAGGRHGKAGSKVYTEFRKACEVGKTRSPVPNDGPVWCQMDTGLCEQKSCKKWWRKVHNGRQDPWKDDRIEYDDLKEVCNWIEQVTPTNRELNAYQRMTQEKMLDDRLNFCRPRWIEGYCEKKSARPRHGQCTMEDGRWCKHGRIFPGSEMDDTELWTEPFKEKKVTVEKQLMPVFFVPPPPSAFAKPPCDRATGMALRCSRRPAAKRHESFL